MKVLAPLDVERVTFSKSAYTFTYPFTLRLRHEIDPVILEFCWSYQVCLAQVGVAVWHTVACLRYLTSRTQKNLSFAHVIHLYSPKIFRGGMVKLSKGGHNAIITSLGDENDRGWMKTFISIASKDIIPSPGPSIPETWNYTRTFSYLHVLFLRYFHAL